MATQLQIRRGTTAQMNAFTGAEGELAVNTSTDTVHVHDGATAGGFALAKADGSNIGTYAGSFTTISASGAITGNVTGNLTGNVTGNVTGDVTGDLTGSVLTAAQTNITSVGTLTGLTLSGTLSLPNANATNEISFTGTEFTNVLSATTSGFQLGTTGAGYLSFLTNNTDRMRIDSNGTIKSSVNGAVANLILENDADTPYVAFTESGAAQFYIGESSIIGGGGGYDIYAATNQGITFFTNAQRRLDIDPSGNLLVGTTSTSIPNQSSNTGIFLFGGGSINVARSGDECAIFNRLTSDGEIVRIQKDGSTVGSIGTLDGNSIYIGNGDVNLRMIDVTDDIRPVTSAGTNRDAAVDLGDANARFKDLYLSGGVVFGDAGGSGTPTSNTLDSYEEGTWTPVLTTNSTPPSVTYTAQAGAYTKVGRMIYVSGFFSWSALSGGAGSYRIAGLPFTILNSVGAYPQMVSTDYSGVTFGANDITFGGYGATNGTYILLLAARNNGTSSNAISGLATSGFIYFNLTYQAA